MPARQKLNAAALNGAAAVAALIGAVTGSWRIFGVAAAVLVVGAFVSGDLRPTPRRR
jgi:hypothetical protein